MLANEQTTPAKQIADALDEQLCKYIKPIE